MRALCRYSWPGNVRELAHVIERAVILSEGDLLDVSSVVGNTPEHEKETSYADGQNNLVSERENATDYDTFNLEVLEQRAVGASLKHHQGNVSQAAKALGLTRGAMYRRLDKYGL